MRIYNDATPADSKSVSNQNALVVLEGMLSANDSIAPSLARQFMKSNKKNLQKNVGAYTTNINNSDFWK